VEAGNRGAPLAEVRVSRIEDDEVISITDGRTSAWSPVWSSDERYLYFVSNLVGGMDLWRRRMRDGRPEGEPERVSAGIGMTSAAFSPDGKKLAYSRGRTVSNVWRVPILRERPATWADAQQITFDDAFIESLDVSPDGRRIAVDSDRAGNADLWILQTDGGPMTQFTTDATPDWSPAWSPDGEEIGFYAFRSGNRQVWVQPVTSGTARQLTKR
jgi:TolB protein